jgi:tetratricopeptide (TPR) repeat protein
VAIEGPLRELGIHDVFQLLDLSRKTGVLRVVSELRNNEGKVYFDGGAVVYAEIRSNPHPLGTLLVHSGKIDEADLGRARDLQLRGDKRRLGRILVATGAITERELERQVRQQIEEVIFELMNWHEGFFSFSEETLREVPADILVRIPTEALLMEGARRIDEWSLIQKKIPHLGMVPALAGNQLGGQGDLDLLPSEWGVLVAIDGTRDVRQLAVALGNSEFETAKTIFGLESAGVLVLAEGSNRPGVREAPDLDEVLTEADARLDAGQPEAARALLDPALGASPSEPRLHLLLGRVHLMTGRAIEAEEALRRAIKLDPTLASAHRLLGNALILRGRLGEAVESWERWLGMSAGSEASLGERETINRAIRAARDLDTAVKVTHV